MKKGLLLLLCIIILLIGGCSIYSNRTVITDWFLNKISVQLNKELEDAQNAKYGTKGKDTILVLGDGKFQIGHYSSGNCLEMYYDPNTYDILLQNIIKYHKESDMLYILSEEGYGLINSKENTCKLFITIPEDEFYNGYYTDEDNQKHKVSRFITDEHIGYLDSYDGYTLEEKRIFEEMKKST